MAKKATRKNECPHLLVKDLVAEVSHELGLVRKGLADLRKSIHDQLLAHFESNCGCPTCRGRGWVVVWDTLDSMSGCYAEYGQCPDANCTKESRTKSGLHPDTDKYDRINGVRDPVEKTDAWVTLSATLTKRVHELESTLRTEALRTEVRRGDRVVISRGKDKSSIGRTGEVFWTKQSEWGNRCGVRPDGAERTKDGEVVWTYTRNCDRLA